MTDLNQYFFIELSILMESNSDGTSKDNDCNYNELTTLQYFGTFLKNNNNKMASGEFN